MKLAIFGATGRTGLPLVQQALDAGHQISALVRTPSKMPIQHANLTLIQGDVMNPADVEKAVQGADAVISVLGPARHSPSGVMGTAGRNIVSAMEAHGVKRLLYMTGAGVPASQDKPALINHVIKFALKTLAGKVLEDSTAGVEAVHTSRLDWTIVRAPMLTDGPTSGRIRIGWVGVGTGPRMTRADAATALLRLLDDPAYLRQSPMISN